MLQTEPDKAGFPERNRNELPLRNPIVDRSQPIKARDPTESFSKQTNRKNNNNKEWLTDYTPSFSDRGAVTLT